MSGARNRRERKREQLLEQLRELAARVAAAANTPRWPWDVHERDFSAAMELVERFDAAVNAAIRKGCAAGEIAQAAELTRSAIYKRAEWRRRRRPR